MERKRSRKERYEIENEPEGTPRNINITGRNQKQQKRTRKEPHETAK